MKILFQEKMMRCYPFAQMDRAERRGAAGVLLFTLDGQDFPAIQEHDEIAASGGSDDDPPSVGIYMPPHDDDDGSFNPHKKK